MHSFQDLVRQLFAEIFGEAPGEVVPVAGDGSSRRYVRLRDAKGRSAIGAYGPDREENRAFLSFSRTFRSLELPVPEVYAADEPAGVWLLEDLGDETLFDMLLAARREDPTDIPQAVNHTYRRVLETLPRFQVAGGHAIDFEVAYPRAAFDRQSILWDLNYFKYHFLKLAHVPFSEARLEEDFDRLAAHLAEADTGFFLYRDFQSRNIMVRNGEPWFIDYQGGRRGALQYDVASLLYDAKADLPPALRRELLETYLDALAVHADVSRERFLEYYPGYLLVRVLQALGAYGYRGFFERKPRFLQSVPLAAHNIREVLAEGLPVRLPEIAIVLERIAERWDPELTPRPEVHALTVQTGSFRFGGGYPEDPSGHGGGYVLDCRGIPNPGREAAFRSLTGLDGKVVAFLAARPEVEAFWSRVRDLADAHVREYAARGFHSLSIQFGCTGGQHRSVYFAERLARHIEREHEGVQVQVTHRERADWPRRAAPTART